MGLTQPHFTLLKVSSLSKNSAARLGELANQGPNEAESYYFWVPDQVDT